MQNPLERFFPVKTAYAHCDIPCGIYDPHPAQMAAHTVIRMTQLISEQNYEDNIESKRLFASQIARLTRVKEEHGHLVEDELGTLENDYFKDEHFQKFPNLKDLLAKGVKLSIATRQNIDMKSAEELLETTMQIAEIFFKTKGVTPLRVKSVYPTGGEIVTHK